MSHIDHASLPSHLPAFAVDPTIFAQKGGVENVLGHSSDPNGAPYGTVIAETLCNKDTSADSRIVICALVGIINQFGWVRKDLADLTSAVKTISERSARIEAMANKQANSPSPPPPPPATPKTKAAGPATTPKTQKPTYADKAKAPAQRKSPPPPLVEGKEAKPPTLRRAERCFYSKLEFNWTGDLTATINAKRLFKATVSTKLSAALESAHCTFPMTSLSVHISEGSQMTVSVTGPPHIPSAAYVPYFALLTEALNTAYLPVLAVENQDGLLPNNQFHLFEQAPTNVDVAIHSVPCFALGETNEGLLSSIASPLAYNRGVTAISARYLRTDPATRKATTTIVVVMSEEDASKMGDTIPLFGMTRKCNVMWNASAATQCRICYRLGHATQGCREKTPTCPLCSGPHSKTDHRCPNTSCSAIPSNEKPCCSVSPLKCTNCEGPHAATTPACPARTKANLARKARSQLNQSTEAQAPADPAAPMDLQADCPEVVSDAPVTQ